MAVYIRGYDIDNSKKGERMIKVLNLYAGIGGNRKLWKNVEVTAVENNPEIAKIYQDFFPQDKVIVTDAHQFLLEHYKEFDFIWSSPPCQSHSHIRKELGVDLDRLKPIYPDMKLYEEIIFLKHFFKGKFVVENVKPYYKPMYNPQIVNRHCFWSNFYIEPIKISSAKVRESKVKELENYHGFDISKYKIAQRKDQILRNCVNPKLGLHIFNMAFKDKQRTLI